MTSTDAISMWHLTPPCLHTWKLRGEKVGRYIRVTTLPPKSQWFERQGFISHSHHSPTWDAVTQGPRPSQCSLSLELVKKGEWGSTKKPCLLSPETTTHITSAYISSVGRSCRSRLNTRGWRNTVEGVPRQRRKWIGKYLVSPVASDIHFSS